MDSTMDDFHSAFSCFDNNSLWNVKVNTSLMTLDHANSLFPPSGSKYARSTSSKVIVLSESNTTTDFQIYVPTDTSFTSQYVATAGYVGASIKYGRLSCAKGTSYCIATCWDICYSPTGQAKRFDLTLNLS